MNRFRRGYNIRKGERQVENENNFELFVQGKNPRDKACKLIRPNGVLQVEFKLKSKDKLVPATNVIYLTSNNNVICCFRPDFLST